MNRFYRLLLTTTIFTVLSGTVPASAVCDYSIFNGFQDSYYRSYAIHKQNGLLDAFDSLGLRRYKYLNSSPWYFIENSFVARYWTYTYPQFDSIRSDYSMLTVNNGPAGTYRDRRTGRFYVSMCTRNKWNGMNSVTNCQFRLGESCGYLSNDAYQGFCRYFIALGPNTMALGPAMSDRGCPTFSRPDLFNKCNSYHANPFKIWGPVMTNGLRMVMGFTGYTYSSTGDRSKWRRFGTYWRLGYSIANSYAKTAMNADSRQIPVVMVQGSSVADCKYMLDHERTFRTYRPGDNCLVYRWWTKNGLRNYNGYYVWSDAGDPETIPQSAGAYVSTESPEAHDAAVLKYLEALGFEQDASVYAGAAGKTPYKIDEDRQVWVDRESGSVYYRDANALCGSSGPCQLTQDECIDRAASLLFDSGLVEPNELKVDSVVTVNEMVASSEELAADTFSGDPEVVRYIVVFKRNLGALPVLTNDTDTITVEIGQTGEVASLISTYQHGRTVRRAESVATPFRTIEEAKAGFSELGTIEDVKAGLLPAEDGTYVPVFEVTRLDDDPESAGCARVQHYSMDTLELIDRVGPDPDETVEAEVDDAVQP